MKTAKPVDRTKLESAIQTIEQDGPMANLLTLHKAVADEYNRTAESEISHSIVMLRIKEWALPIKTQKGKKGRRKGHRVEGGVRTKRADKFSASTKIQEHFKILRDAAPQSSQNAISRIENGSLKAAVKEKCKECCGYEDYKDGIKGCEILACPLWAFRPYQA